MNTDTDTMTDDEDMNMVDQKTIYERIDALTERLDDMLERLQPMQVVSTAAFAVTYTGNGVTKRYEAGTVYDLLTLIERTRTQEMEFEERDAGDHSEK
jgi:tetrahydromethanopterin S-methyltransferase subunit B